MRLYPGGHVLRSSPGCVRRYPKALVSPLPAPSPTGEQRSLNSNGERIVNLTFKMEGQVCVCLSPLGL